MEAYLRLSNVFLFLTVSLVATLVTSSPSPVAGDKVKLNLYYESLCPGCQNFILNDLSQIFISGLIKYVDLKLSPYGNAKLLDNGTIVCQHGERECNLNTLEACAIHALPDVREHFTFIYCVEYFADHGNYDKWKTCSKKLKVNPKPVFDCMLSGLGYKLELQYADEIGALKPPHRYVPWVTVDGQPLLEDFENVMSYVCKAYKGPDVLEPCHSCTICNKCVVPLWLITRKLWKSLESEVKPSPPRLLSSVTSNIITIIVHIYVYFVLQCVVLFITERERGRERGKWRRNFQDGCFFHRFPTLYRRRGWRRQQPRVVFHGRDVRLIGTLIEEYTIIDGTKIMVLGFQD